MDIRTMAGLLAETYRFRLRSQLADPDPASRERAIADVIAVYELAGAGAPPSNGKETL